MVIDLDARPAAAGTSSRNPRPAIAAVLLAVLALGGSAAPPPGLRRVLSVANTSGVFALAPAGLFTADLGRAPGRQATVSGYSLAGPSTRWSTELPQTVGRLDLAGPARVLAVRPAQVLMTTSVDSPRTTFLDSGTGEILWSTTTGRILRLAGTSALMSWGAAGAAVTRHVDLRTGRTLEPGESGSGGLTPAGGPALRVDPARAGRAWVRVTGPRDVVRTVGAVDSVVPGRCAVVAGHLACPTHAGRLDVWRLPD